MGIEHDPYGQISGRNLLSALEVQQRQYQNQAMQHYVNSQLNISSGINQSGSGIYPGQLLTQQQAYYDYARDTYVASPPPFAKPAPIPKPKTNLQWLDERVEEIRFKL